MFELNESYHSKKQRMTSNSQFRSFAHFQQPFLEEGRQMRLKEMNDCEKKVQQSCQTNNEYYETQLQALNDHYNNLEKEAEKL